MSLVSFLTAFNTRVSTLTERYYYGSIVPENVKLPYAWGRYSLTNDVEKLEDFMIDIDVIDNNPDCTDIETIVQNIDGDGDIANPSGMNYYRYSSGGISFRCFRVNRLALDSIDENIVRRQLRYRVRTKL